MIATQCIDNSIPFVRLTDTVGFALDLMQEFKTSALAVLNKEMYCGLITENFLLELDDTLLIDALNEHLLTYKISSDLHLFDVIKSSAEFDSFFLPVVNATNEYLGISTPQKILAAFSQNTALNNSGGILVLEMDTKNYSLTEISKIVESNNAMILHSILVSTSQANQIQVSLKINKNDLKDIQLSFERFQYNVVAVFHQSEYEHQLQERYESLMRYLEV